MTKQNTTLKANLIRMKDALDILENGVDALKVELQSLRKEL